MKIVKSDWAILKEKEQEGLVASMTGIVERIRTDKNNELSHYFREKLPNYLGSFDEEIAEDVIYELNEYLKENTKLTYNIDFPYSSGDEIYLIPIGENIKLKVLVVDEYYGDGEYSKYVDMSYFVINEHTTKKDIDLLIDVLNKHFLYLVK